MSLLWKLARSRRERGTKHSGVGAERRPPVVEIPVLQGGEDVNLRRDVPRNKDQWPEQCDRCHGPGGGGFPAWRATSLHRVRNRKRCADEQVQQNAVEKLHRLSFTIAYLP